MDIKKVAVIGAGVMGAAIAAQAANAGYQVELLDIVPRNNPDRDFNAKDAIDKMVKMKGNVQPLMHKKNAKLIRPGNLEDHMDRLKECDLIIEAVIENPKIKSDLFKKIDAVRKPGSVVGSNTSTIPLSVLADGQTDAFKKDFMITHFFNPPRYMELLELVTSKETNPDSAKAVEKFMDEKMGKGVIYCKDTPGFIANRIGTFWIQSAINSAHKHKLTVEEADGVGGKPMGFPKTGVFDLVDLVGLDLMPHISKSLLSTLPSEDGYRKIHTEYPLFDKMIKDGFTGRKGKGGFYRVTKSGPDGEKKTKEVIDLATGQYSEVKKPKLAAFGVAKKEGLKGLVEMNDKYGQYAWDVLKQTLVYAASLVPDIADDITKVDAAMRTGYRWEKGPFEMIDKMGADYLIDRLQKEGEKVPDLLMKAKGKTFYKTINGKLNHLGVDGQYQEIKRPDGVLLLSDIKRGSKPVVQKRFKAGPLNLGAALWDIGDGVLCLEFQSKMNAIDPLILKMVDKACDMIGDGKGKWKGLVVHNESDNFSVGANVGLASLAGKLKQGWWIDRFVKQGQDTYKRLKYAPFPSVGAPTGLALGGGCEILLHCSSVQAHAETYMGLVEVGVGLIPGWGGCTEMTARAHQNKKMPKGPMPPVAAVFETIGTAKVPLSAQEARDAMLLRDTDGVTMNKARLLADAKKKVLDMSAAGYTPPKPVEFELPGASGKAALSLAVDGFYLKGQATSYDVVVMEHLARTLTGGDKADVGIKMTEDDIRALEREAFKKMTRDPRTLARIRYMLDNNKPLREKYQPGLTARELRQTADPKPSMLASFFGGAKSGFCKASSCTSKKAGNDNAACDMAKKDKKQGPAR